MIPSGSGAPQENLSDLTAVILAGGLGTRLRSTLPCRPKVLAPVGGRPFIFGLLEMLQVAGVREAILCTGYLGEQVSEAIGSTFGSIQVRYSHETHPLGTGGAIRHALALVRTPRVLVMNGDSICNVDVRALVRSHIARASCGTIVLTWVPDTSRFGLVEVGAGERVRAFREKTPEGGPGWINAGFYLLDRALLEDIPHDFPISLERDVFPRWVARGLGAFRTPSHFLDIGTPESLAHAEDFLRSVRADGREARRCFVVLDRDGTLIEERDHLVSPGDVRLLAGAAEGLRDLRDRGLGLVVVTNQSVIGRGWLDPEGLERIHECMSRDLSAQGVTLDGIYFCPHRPNDGCACRKPEVGLVLRAAAEHSFDPALCFYVGDKACDVELGLRLGGTTVLVRTGHGAETGECLAASAHHVARDFAGAARWICDRIVTA